MANHVGDLCVTPKQLQDIKERSAAYWEKAVPKGLSLEELQIFLICQGFLDFLKSKGVELSVKVVFKKDNRDGNQNSS
jgi:hypothetical protein